MVRDEKVTPEELNLALEQENFIRAAELAKNLNLAPEKIKEIQLQALWEMAAINRNAIGTKKLALEYGISPTELNEFLQKKADQKKQEGNDRTLRPRYDYHSGKYFDFAEWLEHYIKK